MIKIRRRTLLSGLGAAAATSAIGCAGSRRELGDDASVAPDATPSPGDGSPPTDAGSSVQCSPSGLGFGELFEGIDTVVVLCMENRSFDHYLGSLSLSEGHAVDGLTGAETNPTLEGDPVGVYRLNDFTPDDPPHSWDDCHAQWNDGGNDGFVAVHAGTSQHQVMGYHERDQLPTLYALADHAAICDRYFSSVLGPTWPNRYYLHCGSAGGRKLNTPKLGLPTLWGALDAANVSNKNYFHDVPWATAALQKATGFVGIEQYFDDAAAGTLPAFSVIDPDFLGPAANDDHPDHDIRLGQALIGSVFAALAQSPQWSRSLFVLTYDEHGGFFDHVPPPTVADEHPEFRRLGFRVPTIIAGPTVKRGCPVSAVYDHTSVVATASRLFGLPPLNDRVALTRDFRDCIDASLVGTPQPAPELPAVEVSLSQVRALPERPRHQEMAKALAAMRVPPHLDRRHESRAIAERVLRYGERLGAVSLRR